MSLRSLRAEKAVRDRSVTRRLCFLERSRATAGSAFLLWRGHLADNWDIESGAGEMPEPQRTRSSCRSVPDKEP